MRLDQLSSCRMPVGKLQLGQFVTVRAKLEGGFVTDGSTAKS